MAEQKEEEPVGIYDVDDPILLEHMILTKKIKHPNTGVALLTKGHMLTQKSINQLINVGITQVVASPAAEESISKAAEHIRGYLHSVEKIIGAKNQSVRNAAAMFQELDAVKELESVMRNQMQNVLRYFNDHAANSLINLSKHHPDSAHHSIITGFAAMSIAKALQWDEEEILEATMAAITHDIGKAKVDLKNLEWPGSLNKKQWENIQLHALFGGVLLKRNPMSTAAMVALNHHEWYADVKDKGYGGLTLFRNIAKKDLGMDVEGFLAAATPEQIEMVQIGAIADTVSALEENRSYKEALPPLKVLIIMNSEASLGRYNPKHYTIWHKSYTRKNRRLLQKGMRLSLPREKELNIERMGKKFIGLDVTARKLTFDELKRMDLLNILKNYLFDIKAIEKDGGISVDRITRRGIEINEKKLKSLGIVMAKKVKVLLPAEEKRLNEDDLIRFGVSEQQLSQKKLANLIKRFKNGVTLPDLNNHVGIQFSKKKLAAAGDSLQKKIFYDLLVMEELGESHALFAIVRQGDKLDELEKANAYNSLDPLQSYLLNKIGLIDIDFSDLTTTLPDMSKIVQGKKWQAVGAAAK